MSLMRQMIGKNLFNINAAVQVTSSTESNMVHPQFALSRNSTNVKGIQERQIEVEVRSFLPPPIGFCQSAVPIRGQLEEAKFGL